MYTRYACIYIIYTPHTPLNTPYTPHIQGPPRRKRPWETCKCTRAGVAHFFKAVAKLCVRTGVVGVTRAKTWVAQFAHGVVQSCLECFCHTRSKAHKYKKTLSMKVRY